MSKRKGKKQLGRPTVMTPEVVGKLEEAFSKGMTDSQACIIAKIHRDTLYAYCAENPDFSDRKEALKSNVNIVAKNNIYDKIIEGDKDVSKWWLERKCKDEFSTRSELTGKDGDAIQTVNFTTDDLKKFAEQLDSI